MIRSPWRLDVGIDLYSEYEYFCQPLEKFYIAVPDTLPIYSPVTYLCRRNCPETGFHVNTSWISRKHRKTAGRNFFMIDDIIVLDTLKDV